MEICSESYSRLFVSTITRGSAFPTVCMQHFCKLTYYFGSQVSHNSPSRQKYNNNSLLLHGQIPVFAECNVCSFCVERSWNIQLFPTWRMSINEPVNITLARFIIETNGVMVQVLFWWIILKSPWNDNVQIPDHTFALFDSVSQYRQKCI